MLRCAAVLFSVILGLFAVPVSAQDMTGTGVVTGVVLRADGQPAEGVTICIADTDRCAASDAKGLFRLPGIRAGQQHIEVRAPGLPPYLSGHVDVLAGREARVEVSLPQIDALNESVTVIAPIAQPPDDVRTSGYQIPPREILKGASALQDVSRSTQTLPGVVIGSNDFRNDLIVRGGSPLENLFVVDNIEIPNINAFATTASAGGSIGLVDASLIRDVTFLTGGFGAPFGNRASSILQMALREGDRERVRGRATVEFLGAGGSVEGPLGGGKGSWVVSARRSFLDLFTDDVGIGGVPVVYALNAKFVYDLSPRDRIWAVNITGLDKLRLGATVDTAADSELANLDLRYKGWRTAFGANWQRVFGSNAVGLLGVTTSASAVDTIYKDLLRSGLPLTTPLDELIAASPVIFDEAGHERETTVKYDLTVTPRRALKKVQAGAAVRWTNASYVTNQPYGFDSPYSAAPGLNPLALDDGVASTDVAAYVQGGWDPWQRVNVTIGGRIDRYGGTSETRVSPRLALGYRVSDRVTWQSAWGIYYQQPMAFLLAAFPENRALLPLRADHYVTGLALAASPSLRFTAEAYWKEYRDYPVATQLPSVTLANIGDTFDVRESLFPLVSDGRGRSVGVEFLLETAFTGTWFGRASLALSRTRHAGLDGIERPGAFDYPAVVNLVGGYRFRPRWELGARFAYLAGRPYTPYDTALSVANNRGIYDLARVYAERAPAYVRLDVRVDYTLRAGPRPLIVYGGAQNIFNRRNFADYTWDRRANEIHFQEQQGILPLVGMDWRF